MKIRSIHSNMTEVETRDYVILISYETPVACKDKKTSQFYRTEKKWSKTTSRHINEWLDGAFAEPRPQPFFNGLLDGKEDY